MTRPRKALVCIDDTPYYHVTSRCVLHFDHATTDGPQSGIPCAFKTYLALVDWTGRAIRDDKRGAIDYSLPPILERLALSPEQWLINTTQFEVIHRRRFNRRPRKTGVG